MEEVVDVHSLCNDVYMDSDVCFLFLCSSRTTHNLLEKNRLVRVEGVAGGISAAVLTLTFLFSCRRAQLRDCLEVLRQHVPFPDKLTTLALLQSAKKYIEVSIV